MEVGSLDYNEWNADRKVNGWIKFWRRWCRVKIIDPEQHWLANLRTGKSGSGIAGCDVCELFASRVACEKKITAVICKR